MATTTSPTIRIDKAGGPEEMHLVDPVVVCGSEFGFSSQQDHRL